jgi:putative flippase GtrA
MLVVERDHRASLGEPGQGGEVVGRADRCVRDDLCGTGIGGLGQDSQTDTEGDRRGREHAGQLPTPDDPDPGEGHASVTIGEPTGAELGSIIVTTAGDTQDAAAAADPPAAQPSGLFGRVGRLRGAVDVFYRELLKFGVVGAAAFIVDAGGYNLLVYGGGSGPLRNKPITATVISVSASVVVAWIGSRWWTFRHRQRVPVHHELTLFVLINAIGLLIAAACLGFSRYALGQDGVLADNIAKTVVGTGLATVFRFWAYRKYVFKGAPGVPQ